MNSETYAPVYIFAGGGTGGHLAPAVAVAECLSRLQPQARMVFACTNRAIDARVLAPSGYAMVVQPVDPIPRSPLALPRFYLHWRRSISLAHRLIRDVKPAAVLGLGGFAAGPMVRVAAGRGVPTALLNPDAVPGKANRYLAKRCDAIFTQFEMTAEHFPASLRAKVKCVGCPIRPSVLGHTREQALAGLGLRGDRRTLLVMGGSLGAESINQAVLGWLDGFAQRADRWQVLHVAGPGKADSVRQAYAGRNIQAVVMDFCDRMGWAYAAADIAIGRAGANSVAELAANGTPALLLPYPFHRDQHQRHNAAAMVSAGAAVIVDDAANASENAQRIGAVLGKLLDDPAELGKMTCSARQLGQPSAAETVARWLISQCGHAD